MVGARRLKWWVLGGVLAGLSGGCWEVFWEA